MSLRGIVLVLMLNLGLSGCFTQKKTFVLPPPAPVVAKPAPEPQFVTPPELESEVPQVAFERVELPMPPQMEPPPSKPVQARKPTPAVTPPPNPAPATPETETPAPVPTAPQLGEILTEDRRREYETLFTQRVSGAQTALNRASTRGRLTPRQKETVQRIKTFLQQAEDSRGKDLVTALEFARRADLFGRDLLKSLQ